MLGFEEFYDIAEYGNKAWQGGFTKKEIAQNAYDYLCEFNTSVKNGEPTGNIKNLYKLLVEDESEECLSWAYDIAKGIGLIDMDFMDYLDTDIEVIARFLEKDNKDKVKISGIIFQHGNDDYGLWEGFYLTEEDENVIWNILIRHDTEGCSVRGTRKQIAKEMEI